MKNFKDIQEGIFDIDDNIENANIDLFKQLFPRINPDNLDITYNNGELSIALKSTLILPIYKENIKDPWINYFKNLHTIIFKGNVCFYVDVTPENFAKNLIFKRQVTFNSAKIIKGVNIEYDWNISISDFTKTIEDCSIFANDKSSRLKPLQLEDLPNFKNINTNIDDIRIYNVMIPSDENITKVFNSMLDTTYTTKIKDVQKKDVIDFNAKNLKQIIAKINNPRRYQSTWGGSLDGESVFKFKDGIDIKKEFGLEDFKNLKIITIRNNNVGFQVLFNWVDTKTHTTRTRATFYKR